MDRDAGAAAQRGCAVADLRAFLAGDWRLARRLVDRRAGRCGVMRGRAVFAGSGTRLVYHEDGRLQFGDYRGTATQTYLYDFPGPAFSGGGRAAIRFADGSPFCDLDLAGGRCRLTHDCGADRYDGIAAVLGPDRWELRWHVCGPRKDLLIATRWRRMGSAASEDKT